MNAKISILKLNRILLIMLFAVLPEIAFAQSTVKGKVTDKSGAPLIGATVSIKNTTIGVITDVNGEYSLTTKNNLTNKNILVFKFIGYKKKEVAFKNTVINVELEDEATQLDNVVVTALGIKREERGLGYSTQTVNGDMITGAMPNNWSSALSGKVAGLSIASPGGPLGSTRISLRGDVSLNQDGNNALIVVDGVPMSSPMTNPGVAYGAGTSSEQSVDYGNGFSDINPEDIENIQVLKGSQLQQHFMVTRAANGVIMVTTKSGSNAQERYWRNIQLQF